METMRGLMMGRFQPFHLGHLDLVKQILSECDKVIIAITSLVNGDVLAAKDGKKLTKNLDKIIKELDKGKDDKACKNLDKFIQSVIKS